MNENLITNREKTVFFLYMQYKNIQNITLRINELKNILTNASNEIKTLEESLDNKADSNHTHADYETKITELENNKMNFRGYNKIQDILNDWSNIPNCSCVMAYEGVEGWDSSYVFKFANLRALTFACNKSPKDYIWVRAISPNGGSNVIGNLKNTPFRKIPVLTTDGQLKCNSAALSGTCVASNIKADNETRLAQCETNIENKANAEHTHTTTDITDLNNLKAEILKSIYPVGSIYTSMTNTSPATLFGFGTWTQITDRFLYCSTSSNTTGGSKTITEENLPAHTHTGTTGNNDNPFKIRNDYDITSKNITEENNNQSYNINPGSWFLWGNKNTATTESGTYRRGMYGYPGSTYSDNNGDMIHRHTFTTESTGKGEDYMPPYITVYCWYRVE